MTLAESRDGRPVTYVAGELGISPQTWRLYEAGRKMPAEILIKYCKRFGLNPLDISLGGQKNDNN